MLAISITRASSSRFNPTRLPRFTRREFTMGTISGTVGDKKRGQEKRLIDISHAQMAAIRTRFPGF